MDEIILNDQYEHLRDCASVSTDVVKEQDFGIAKGCDAPLEWYGVDDKNVTTYDLDEISFDRSEKTSNLPLKQTAAASMEWAKEIELEVNYSHRFIQALIQVFLDAGYSGQKGQELLEMSDGWVWFRERLIYNQGEDNEYIQEWVYPYLKISSMSVPFTGIVDPEAACALSFLVEEFPTPDERGVKPNSYAIPSSWDDLIFENFAFDTEKNSYDVKGYEDVLYTDSDGNYKTYSQIFMIDNESGDVIFVREEINSVAGTIAPLTSVLTLENTYTTALDETNSYYIKVGVFFTSSERFYVNDYIMETTVTP